MAARLQSFQIIVVRAVLLIIIFVHRGSRHPTTPKIRARKEVARSHSTKMHDILVSRRKDCTTSCVDCRWDRGL